MTLKVQLDMDKSKPEAIYVPFLEIDYEEKQTLAIFKEESAKFKTIHFISEYTMS
jgi:hypothetical protein